MAEFYLMVAFLFFAVEAQRFPDCGKKVTCKSWLELEIKVDVMFGKLEELSMIQLRQKMLEEYLILGNLSLSMCLKDIKRLETAFYDKKNRIGDNRNARYFNQSLIREREKSNRLERKLKELEDQLKFNISDTLRKLETANDDDLREIKATVDRIEKENREEFGNLENSIKEKVSTSEVYRFKQEIDDEIAKLRGSFNNVEKVVKDFPSEKQKLIDQQKQTMSMMRELEKQMQTLKEDLETSKKEQAEKYSNLENSLRNVYELLNKRRSDSADQSQEDWNAVLERGINILKESGGEQTDNNFSRSESEETFSDRFQP